jgi:Ca-activated chloride channel family protein
MASLHRFVIVVSAITVVGVIQVLAAEFPSRLMAVDGGISSSLLLIKNALSASEQTINSDTIHRDNGRLQVTIEQANITVVNPYEDAQTGQLYFQSVVENSDLTEPLNKTLARSNSVFTLSDNLQTDVKINVTGMLARTAVSQTFTNRSDEWVDGLYVFPLPENAAVDHLMIQIDERKIEGQIKQKQEAKRIFEQAKREGKKASLVEHRRPNLFTNNIANIGPGETVVINIEYQQTLQYLHDGYSLRFPFTITPRYAPVNGNTEQAETALLTTLENAQVTTQAWVTDTDKDNHNTVASQSVFSDNINISVRLNTGTQLQNIESEHHAIITSTGEGNSYLVTLAESDVKRQDFVLNWQLELGSKPTSAHFTQFVNGSEYGMIVLYPPLPNEQLVLDREVIFVLDTSGSMSGEAIVQAKQALAHAIDDLSTKDKFNIIEFNSNADILWRKAKFADPQNKISAFDFIAKLRANGGTEMHQALSMALLSEADPALFKQILFITDGSVSNEANLMRLIEENLKQARLFTIGIGAAPNSYFMTEAAKSGKGTFTFIGDTKQVKRKMAELMSKINSPALTDIKLNLKGIQQYQQFEMYPNVIGDLYSSDPLVLTYKQPMGMDASFPFSKTEGPMLMGNYNNNAWHFTPQKPVDRGIIQADILAKRLHIETHNARHKEPQNKLTFEVEKKAKGINVLWASEKIAQLSRDKRNIAFDGPDAQFESPSSHSKTSDQQKSAKQRIVQEITATALEHHIVSQYTSLVAVDILPSKSRDLDRYAQNNKALQSQHAFALPQTATNAQLNIMIGVLLMLFSLLINRLKIPFTTKNQS